MHTRLHALWLKWYREGGVAEVCGRRKGGVGNPSYLTSEQQAQLVAEAAKGVFATAQAVRDWIEARFGVVSTPATACTRCCRGWGSG